MNGSHNIFFIIFITIRWDNEYNLLIVQGTFLCYHMFWKPHCQWLFLAFNQQLSFHREILNIQTNSLNINQYKKIIIRNKIWLWREDNELKEWNLENAEEKNKKTIIQNSYGKKNQLF